MVRLILLITVIYCSAFSTEFRINQVPDSEVMAVINSVASNDFSNAVIQGRQMISNYPSSPEGQCQGRPRDVAQTDRPWTSDARSHSC